MCVVQKAGNKREDPQFPNSGWNLAAKSIHLLLHEGSKQNPILLRVRYLHLHSDYEMVSDKENLIKMLPVGMFR